MENTFTRREFAASSKYFFCEISSELTTAIILCQQLPFSRQKTHDNAEDTPPHIPGANAIQTEFMSSFAAENIQILCQHLLIWSVEPSSSSDHNDEHHHAHRLALPSPPLCCLVGDPMTPMTPNGINDTQWHATTPIGIQWHPTTCNDTQCHAMTPNDIQLHPTVPNDIQWHPMTCSDTQWHAMTPNDMQWNPMASMAPNGMQWHPTTPNDMQWHLMAYNDTQWHAMTPAMNCAAHQWAVRFPCLSVVGWLVGWRVIGEAVEEECIPAGDLPCPGKFWG